MTGVTVHCDFFEDVRVQFVDWFAKVGIALPDPNDLQRVCFAYFSVKRRLIVPRPRRVDRSRELRARALSDAEGDAIDRIAREAASGDDMTPRLSRSIMKPEFNDGLLDDWGIHHLHLGSKLEADGFVERDGPLLYVFVRPDTVYFLDLLGHGSASFANDSLIQILHDNWSALIAPFKAPWAVAGEPSPQPTPSERSKARKCLTMGTMVADGTVYLAPGGGASTAGLNVRVVDAAFDLLKRAREAQEWVTRDAAMIRDGIAEQTGKHVDELYMRFLLRDPLSLVETQTNALIPLR